MTTTKRLLGHILWLLASLLPGSIVGGMALDVVGLPVSMAMGAGAGVTASVMCFTHSWWTRRFEF